MNRPALFLLRRKRSFLLGTFLKQALSAWRSSLLNFCCAFCIMLTGTVFNLYADEGNLLSNLEAQPEITVKKNTNDGDVLLQKIKLSTGKGTVYQLLKEISVQSGYSFIYDSQIIENDKKVNLRKGEYTMQQAIVAITGNSRLKIDVLGYHILLRLADENMVAANIEQPPQHTHLTLRGKIFDSETLAPVPYVSVGIAGTTIGTVSNLKGEFQLIIPDTIGASRIKLSHIGYESKDVEFRLLTERPIDFFLQPHSIELQEVVVSIADPALILQDFYRQKDNNYAHQPVYLTSFYREGIEYKKRIIDVTEAVLQIYKTGSQYNAAADQVKLIKKRRITDQQHNDTILPRMKSGVNSCLILDVIKEMPDFINPDNHSSYSYSFNHVTTIDDRRVNVITFRQKPSIEEPMYTGDLYIEDKSKALVYIQFEMNPKLVEKATNYFIERKSRDIKLTLQEARYMVSYQLAIDGLYYINHIRGDIVFKVRRKNFLFSNPLHFWFEMVTCKIDTENVKSFPRSDRLLPDRIFAETKHAYDQNFWDNFNLILPEEKLMETMIKNLNEVIINAE